MGINRVSLHLHDPQGLPKKKRSTKPRAGRDHLRKGKWTVEEEEYTTRIIHYFSNGILTLPEGLTLRAYLSQKLNCDPMRITKKYAGASCLGKRVYHLAERGENSGSEFEKAKLELAHKEKVFRARVENTSGSKYYVEDVSNLKYNTNIVIPDNYISTPASSLPGPPIGSYRNQPMPNQSHAASFPSVTPLSSQYPPYPPPHFHPQFMHQNPQQFPPPHLSVPQRQQQHGQQQPAQHQYPSQPRQSQSPLHAKPSTPAIHTKEDRDLGSILLGFMNTVRHNHPVPPSPPASTAVTSSDVSDTTSSSGSESVSLHQQQPNHHQGDASSNSVANSNVSSDEDSTSFTSSNVALHTKTLDEEFTNQKSLPPQSSATSVSAEGDSEAGVEVSVDTGGGGVGVGHVEMGVGVEIKAE